MNGLVDDSPLAPTGVRLWTTAIVVVGIFRSLFVSLIYFTYGLLSSCSSAFCQANDSAASTALVLAICLQISIFFTFFGIRKMRKKWLDVYSVLVLLSIIDSSALFLIPFSQKIIMISVISRAFNPVIDGFVFVLYIPSIIYFWVNKSKFT